MEIINAHAHIYPEKIAEKATQSVGAFYDLRMETVGTAEKLIEDGKKAGISKYVVHSCATKAYQVHSINEFIKSEMDKHDELIGFMTLHQDLAEEELYNEVEWCIKNGFKGVKLHPDFQKFYIDEERAEKFYRVVGDRLPILMHVGDDRFENSKPKRLARMAKKYPNVNFISAHFGGYLCWDDADCYVGLDNVYFDTCSSLPFMSPERAKGLIDLLGYEKFFFGTDFPMWDTLEEIERVNKIPITEYQKECIFAKNIKRLLKID